MPRSIILEDGSEIEVPTEEELTDLKSKAEKATTLEADLEKLKKESENKENPDWRLARRKLERMESQLKEQGKGVKEDGSIIDQPTHIDPQEILKQATEIATKTANDVALTRYKDELLGSFDEETRKVVQHYYNKLSTGEELSFDKIRSLISEASVLATPNSTTSAARHGSGSGAPPRFSFDANGQQSKKPYSETDEGRKTAEEIWGKDSFTHAK
jgi:hypothetical protein